MQYCNIYLFRHIWSNFYVHISKTKFFSTYCSVSSLDSPLSRKINNSGEMSFIHNIFVYHVSLENRWLSIAYHESQYLSKVCNPFHNIKSNDIDLPHDINFQMISFICRYRPAGRFGWTVRQKLDSVRSGKEFRNFVILWFSRILISMIFLFIINSYFYLISILP